MLIHRNYKNYLYILLITLHTYYFCSEYDEVSPELHNVAQAAMCGFFFGGCFGGFAKSRDAYLYFIENNQATIYTSTMQAKVTYFFLLSLSICTY